MTQRRDEGNPPIGLKRARSARILAIAALIGSAACSDPPINGFLVPNADGNGWNSDGTAGAKGACSPLRPLSAFLSTLLTFGFLTCQGELRSGELAAAGTEAVSLGTSNLNGAVVAGVLLASTFAFSAKGLSTKSCASRAPNLEL